MSNSQPPHTGSRKATPGTTNVIEMNTPELTHEEQMGAPASNPVQPAFEPLHATNPGSQARRPAQGVLVISAIFAVLWSLGAFAYLAGMLGFANLMALPAAQWTGVIFGVVGPAIFIMGMGWAVREMVLFARIAGRMHKMAERLADPARATREDAESLASTVQSQIMRINKSVEGALARLGAMEEVLQHHADSFADAETNARDRTDALIADLRKERDAVEELAGQLDRKAAEIAHAISEQSKMVVSAADIANSQTQDGVRSLNASVELLQDASRRTEASSRSLQNHVQASAELMETTVARLGQARADMQTGTQAMAQAQDDGLQAIDARREELEELLASARNGAQELQTAAEESAQTMHESLTQALDQAHHYTAILREESRAMGEQHAERAKELRTAADEARTALEAYAETISRRLEHANEASFSAASWADRTFEKLQESTAELDARLAKLPMAADESAREIEEKLRVGLAGLNDAARHAAEEAQHIDASFQSRVRQNYELLSELMLKMGATAAPMGSEVEVPNPLKPRTHKQDTGADSRNKIEKPIVRQPASTPAPEAELAIRRPMDGAEKETPRTGRSHNDDGDWSWRDVFSRMEAPIQRPATVATTKSESGADPLESDESLERIRRAVAGLADTPPPAMDEDGTNDVASDSLDRLVDMFRSLDITPDEVFDTRAYRTAALARLADGRTAMARSAAGSARSAANLVRDAMARDPRLESDAEAFMQELRDKVDDAARTGQQMHVETHLRTGDGPAYLLLEAALVD